jgi:hypothetical protein
MSRRRSLFRYGLRSFLLFVAIASCGLGWVGARHHAKLREREAVAAFTFGTANGRVLYDYQYNPVSNKVDLSAKPPGPSWIRALLGDDYFATVHVVSLRPVEEKYYVVSNLRHLKSLSGLRRLDIDRLGYPDDVLVHIEGLTNLERLNMSRCHFTDAALVHLKGLSQLKELDLRATRIKGKGLSNLRGLNRLEKLDLSANSIDESDVIHLISVLPQLRELSLEPTKMSDEGLRRLGSLRQLEELSVSGRSVTDAGMVHLSHLRKLTFLGIRGTSVTDAGLMQLKELTSLKTLCVDIRISPEGRKKFLEAMPHAVEIR